MDIYDQAQALEQQERDAALERQAEAAGLSGMGSLVCTDCGGKIPPERREALPSAIRCLECQSWAERIAQQRRSP